MVKMHDCKDCKDTSASVNETIGKETEKQITHLYRASVCIIL
jgi:hypothetical protein